MFRASNLVEVANYTEVQKLLVSPDEISKKEEKYILGRNWLWHEHTMDFFKFLIETRAFGEFYRGMITKCSVLMIFYNTFTHYAFYKVFVFIARICFQNVNENDTIVKYLSKHHNATCLTILSAISTQISKKVKSPYQSITYWKMYLNIQIIVQSFSNNSISWNTKAQTKMQV